MARVGWIQQSEAGSNIQLLLVILLEVGWRRQEERVRRNHIWLAFYFPEGEAMSVPPAALQTVWHRGQGARREPSGKITAFSATDGVGADQPVCTQLEVSALIDSSKPTILQQTRGI